MAGSGKKDDEEQTTDAPETDAAATEEGAASAAPETDAAAGIEAPPAATEDDEPVSTEGIAAEDNDALHSVGMFLAGDADHVDLDDVELPPELQEPSFAQLAKNKTSWVVLIASILVAIGGSLYINQTEELRIQVELLFKGGIDRHKRAHIIELKEKYQKEDKYAQNRYGEFKMIYSPRDAEVSVTMLKYREKISDFMTRYIKGLGDKRELVEERELKKFKELTSDLEKNQVVNEQNIKNLPVTSRTNPKDAENPGRMKACTDSKEDYCTFVYKIKITKDKYRPREFVVFSEYSLDPPGLEMDANKVQQLLFKRTGPSIFEVMWPGADLQPTPELFQEQFIRVMTDRIKCKMGPEDYKNLELKKFADLMALPEDERWQKLADNGLLSHGPPAAKVWTLMEWKSSVAELRQPENLELWTSAQATIDGCKCEEGVKCWGDEAPAPK